jgi:thymidylate synthase (FAD)
MGDDAAIVQAARVSYGAGTKTVREDRGLINYLLEHRHTSPFEMCELKFHCKLPIFAARQWIRHRTANVNEVSARYSIVKDEFYMPAREQLTTQSKDNKQGRSAEPVSNEHVVLLRAAWERDAEEAFDDYTWMVEEVGLSRELARIGLPLSTYTEWYWKIDLHNLLHFLRLRLDSHAQYEIRVFAEAMASIVKQLFPLTWEAFEEHVLYAVTLSRSQVAAVRALLEQLQHARSAVVSVEKRTLELPGHLQPAFALNAIDFMLAPISACGDTVVETFQQIAGLDERAAVKIANKLRLG